MKTKLKKLSDSRVAITVTLDKDDLKPAHKKALAKLAKEIKVEGFRQGKVPVEVAKKFIPENDLNAETIDLAVRTTVIEAFQKEEKSPLVLPNVNVTKYVPGEMAEYTAEADIIPEIKLGEYKKLGLKKPDSFIFLITDATHKENTQTTGTLTTTIISVLASAFRKTGSCHSSI